MARSKLNGARALVIGGTSGIGFGVADELLEQGAHVIVSSSSADKVSKAIQRLQEAHPAAKDHIEGYACDLSKQATLVSEVGALFEKATKGGKLDHVVLTAGDAAAIRAIEDFSFDDILQAGMVRFFAATVIAQQLRKNLNDGPASSFTMTTGTSVQRPFVGWSIIAAYFGGVNGLCKGLARDLAPIRVNVVEPGAIETELWDKFKEAGHLDELKASLKDKMATGRIGRVQDIAESYLYLMKDQNATAVILESNGGGMIM